MATIDGTLIYKEDGALNSLCNQAEKPSYEQHSIQTNNRIENNTYKKLLRDSGGAESKATWPSSLDFFIQPFVDITDTCLMKRNASSKVCLPNMVCFYVVL